MASSRAGFMACVSDFHRVIVRPMSAAACRHLRRGCSKCKLGSGRSSRAPRAATLRRVCSSIGAPIWDSGSTTLRGRQLAYLMLS